MTAGDIRTLYYNSQIVPQLTYAIVPFTRWRKSQRSLSTPNTFATFHPSFFLDLYALNHITYLDSLNWPNPLEAKSSISRLYRSPALDLAIASWDILSIFKAGRHNRYFSEVIGFLFIHDVRYSASVINGSLGKTTENEASRIASPLQVRSRILH